MKTTRKTVSFPRDLAEIITERAREGNRSFSSQVVYELLLITKVVTKEQIEIWVSGVNIEEKE